MRSAAASPPSDSHISWPLTESEPSMAVTMFTSTLGGGGGRLRGARVAGEEQSETKRGKAEHATSGAGCFKVASAGGGSPETGAEKARKMPIAERGRPVSC